MWMHKKTTIAELVPRRIEEIAAKKKIKYDKLAEKSGVSLRMLGYIRKQERSPTIETIDAIAGALGVEPWELLVDQSEGPQVIRPKPLDDDELLANVMDAVDAVFLEKKIPLPTIKKARIIAIIYNRYVGQNSRPKEFKAEVIELFKLVA